MIQPGGPSSVKCKRVLEVRDGRFVHAHRDAFDKGFRGFHIPQIIVPAVVYNPLRWAEIYRLKLKIKRTKRKAPMKTK